MGTALKSLTAHLLTEFWLQNMRGMFIVALRVVAPLTRVQTVTNL